MPKPTRELPAPLAEAQKQIDAWRRNGDSRRIPEVLWTNAVELAAKHGVHRTSRALRLNYDTLRRRLESQGPSGENASPVFVDLMPGGSGTAGGDGVAEMIDAEGATIHIEWSGGAAPDLAAVAAAFYGARP